MHSIIGIIRLKHGDGRVYYTSENSESFRSLTSDMAGAQTWGGDIDLNSARVPPQSTKTAWSAQGGRGWWGPAPVRGEHLPLGGHLPPSRWRVFGQRCDPGTSCVSKKGWQYQIGWIFGKAPKIYIADFGPLYRALNRDFRGKLQYDFPRVREESEGHLEFFRKFIRFGSAICL